MSERTIKDYRFFLKDSIRKEIDFNQSDQNRGLPPPEVQKPFRPDQQLINLVRPDKFTKESTNEISDGFSIPLLKAINGRKSVRQYSNGPLSLRELSLLLWATQGMHEMRGPSVTLRTVPSAGSRHAFETYLYVRDVTGLEEGIYRYLPLTHQLAFEFEERNLTGKIAAACFDQWFVSEGAVTFFWAAVPYRMEWRYGLAAHKVIALDAGHICQNLYLACEAIGAGTCAIGAYDQELLDDLLRLDGEKEFVVYLAPVGKKV